MVINKVSITPNPIEPGKKVEIKIAGVMSKFIIMFLQLIYTILLVQMKKHSGEVSSVTASIDDKMIIKDYKQNPL